jgi:hypothetical protein
MALSAASGGAAEAQLGLGQRRAIVGREGEGQGQAATSTAVAAPAEGRDRRR